jgi:hypothetical protein
MDDIMAGIIAVEILIRIMDIGVGSKTIGDATVWVENR